MYSPQAFSGPTATNTQPKFRTTNHFSETFSGPIAPDPEVQRSARRESMARAGFAGDPRGYLGQAGPGVRAGGKMAGYRAAMTADAEANKAYAQAQQDQFNQYATQASANLQYQQAQAGERNWLRDLLLDKDDTLNRERMAALKRKVDFELAGFQRRTEDAVARDRRKAEETAAFWGSFL